MAEQRVIDAVAEAYSFAAADATIDQIRSGYDASMARAGIPNSVTAVQDVIGGVPGTWYRPAGSAGGTVLHLHGGGFRFGSSRSHGPLAAELAAASSAAVFVADYRLAPEHPFPAAVDDAVAALAALITREGAERVAISGDSAGGGLALAALLAVKDRGGQLPAAATAQSMWADLTMRSPSVTERAGRDPLMTREQLDANAADYLGAHDPADPLASPVYGDLSGLPPVYLQVGTEEILHDDTTRVAEGIRAAGGRATVEMYDGMPHVHQILLGNLPEAHSAIARTADFIRDVLAIQ